MGAGLNLLRIAAPQNPQIAATSDNLNLLGVGFEIYRITLANNLKLLGFDRWQCSADKQNCLRQLGPWAPSFFTISLQ